MIVVKVELWPGGREDRAREIGRTYIANDGEGTPDRGDYKVAVCRRGTNEVPREIYADGDAAMIEGLGEKLPKAARAGEGKDYPRLAYNVWRLIARSILTAFPEEQRGRLAVKSHLGELAARGLRCIRDAWREDNGENYDRPAVAAAEDWLDAANRDDL